MVGKRELSFIVPGDPVPKERPRTVKLDGGRIITYTPRKTKAFEEMVALQARVACGRVCWNTILKVEPVTVGIVFHFEIPKSRKGQEGQPHTVAPDADNCVKSVLDALNQLAWADDCQVANLSVVKVWDTKAYTEVYISARTYSAKGEDDAGTMDTNREGAALDAMVGSDHADGCAQVPGRVPPGGQDSRSQEEGLSDPC